MTLEELKALVPVPHPATGAPQVAAYTVDNHGSIETLTLKGVGIDEGAGFGVSTLVSGRASWSRSPFLMSIKPILPPGFQQGDHLIISDLDWELTHVWNDEEVTARTLAFIADLILYDPTAANLGNGWEDDPLDMGRACL